MRARFDALSNVVLVLAASTIALAVARREFITDRPAPESAALAEPKYHPKWQELLAHGRVIGHERASVRIVEFADLQCPFCREFHQAFLDVQRELGESALSLFFVHFPFSSHKQARAAARAAECAGAQGKFAAFVSTAFRLQDSLGVKPWGEFAAKSDVQDTILFLQCARDSLPVRQVEAGLAVGEALGVRGTPTVIINGWRFNGRLPKDQLRSVVDDVRAGRKPRLHSDE